MTQQPPPHREGVGRTTADEVDLRSDLRAARREVDLVRAEADRRAVVEQAKGILIARYHCSPVAAEAILSRWAGTTSADVGRVAEDVVRIARGLPLQADRRGTGTVRRGQLARLHMELFAPHRGPHR